LLWQATDKVPHYRSNLCRSWHDAFDQFEFVAIDSAANVLSMLPEHWRKWLASSEVYFAEKDATLMSALEQLGVKPGSMFYP